jgi:hypothetical protein
MEEQSGGGGEGEERRRWRRRRLSRWAEALLSSTAHSVLRPPRGRHLSTVSLLGPLGRLPSPRSSLRLPPLSPSSPPSHLLRAVRLSSSAFTVPALPSLRPLLLVLPLRQCRAVPRPVDLHRAELRRTARSPGIRRGGRGGCRSGRRGWGRRQQQWGGRRLSLPPAEQNNARLTHPYTYNSAQPLWTNSAQNTERALQLTRSARRRERCEGAVHDLTVRRPCAGELAVCGCCRAGLTGSVDCMRMMMRDESRCHYCRRGASYGFTVYLL